MGVPVLAAALVAVLWVSMAAHEAGHVVVARMAGLHVARVQVGSGPRVATWQLRHGVHVELRAFPLAGQTTTVPALQAWEPHGAGVRLGVVLAGPAVNLAAVACLVAVGAVQPSQLLSVPPPQAGVAAALAWSVASVNLLLGVGNLVPLPPADGSWALAAAASLAAGRDGTPRPVAARSRTAVQLVALAGVLVAVRVAGAALGW